MSGFSKKLLFSLKKIIITSRESDPEKLLKQLYAAESRAYPRIITNPMTRNALVYIFHKFKPESISVTKSIFIQRIDNSINHLSNSFANIAAIGSKKIKKGMSVFVHGYSDSVMAVLLKAKKDGIDFEVHCTEEKPYCEGRPLATNLAKHKIPVKFYADLALRQALKRADIVMIGAKVIGGVGQVYGRIGSELIADVAERYEIPVYVCADTWKINKHVADEFDKSTKLMKEDELWSNPPKGIKILNYGFEKIHPWLITGIITEKGIYKIPNLLFELKKQNHWL